MITSKINNTRNKEKPFPLPVPNIIISSFLENISYIKNLINICISICLISSLFLIVVSVFKTEETDAFLNVDVDIGGVNNSFSDEMIAGLESQTESRRTRLNI